jgi:hypothetical protein
VANNIHWWQVLWPLLSASGVLFVFSSRFEKIFKGQLHKWNLSKIVKESSKREKSKKDHQQKQQPENENENENENTAFRATVQVSSLFIHPIKSLRPVSVSSAKLNHRGIEGDRFIMLVRPSPSSGRYRFLTQRQCPKLATINVSLPRRREENDTTVIEISNSDHT